MGFWESLPPLPIILSIIVAAGGGIGWWVRRVERREDLMIELWKQRALDAEGRADDAEKRTVAETLGKEIWERRATSWHQQLIDNGIKPDPGWGDPL